MRPELPSDSLAGHITLARLVSKFLEWVDGRYRGGHAVKNLEYSIRAVLNLYRNDPAKAFGSKKLQEVRLLMARQGRTWQVINKATGYICQMFKWAVAEELVKPDQLVALTA